MNAIQFIQQHGVEKAREVVAASANALVQCKDGSKFHVSDLKRLVDSIDLIKFYGGIERAKLLLAMGTCLADRPPHAREVQLKQAIADYEAIYFKIGDLVVCTDDGLEAKYLTVKKITGFIDDWGLELNDGEHWVDTYRFRRATAEEEAVGHRIEQVK